MTRPVPGRTWCVGCRRESSRKPSSHRPSTPTHTCATMWPATARVYAMSENRVDPSGNTEQFRAFVESAEPAQKSRLPLILVGAAAALAVVIVIVLLAVLT